jgi:hypothetical protein
MFLLLTSPPRFLLSHAFVFLFGCFLLLTNRYLLVVFWDQTGLFESLRKICLMNQNESTKKGEEVFGLEMHV